MFSAILIILTMPFTDLSRSRGIQFRPLSKIAFFIFLGNFLILMKLGAKHVESPYIEFGQISTALYFSYFLIIVPAVSLLENSLIELATLKDKDPVTYHTEQGVTLSYSYSLSITTYLTVLFNKTGISSIGRYNYVNTFFYTVLYTFILNLFIIKFIVNSSLACDAPRP